MANKSFIKQIKGGVVSKQRPVKSMWRKLSKKKRLNSIFYTMKETVKDWKLLNIYEKYKFKFIKHILHYIVL